MNAKPYEQMNAQELQEATRQFDKPMVAIRNSKPLTRKQTAQLRRVGLISSSKKARRQGARNAKSERVTFSIPRRLLVKADKLAKSKGIHRSELIALGIESLLAKAS